MGNQTIVGQNRVERDLERLTQESFDVLVVGGGIYGACVAWDAALRGLSVALLEKGDFGQATSANSLKTIHGGLRYLQRLDIKRMRQSIQERRNLMRIAPHLVHPLPCIAPVYGHGFKGREMMTAALLLNDLISFDRNRLDDRQKHLPAGRIISAAECKDLLPGIEARGLTAGAVWYDGQMYNSERMTLSFVTSAAARGAVTANYVEVTGFISTKGKISGVQARDQLTGATFSVRARVTVNASGPWLNQVLDLLPGRPASMKTQLAKAINIATRPLVQQFAVGVSGGQAVRRSKARPGNRLLFIVPWRRQTLIGTTYQHYSGNPDHLAVTEQDVQELLDETNAIFPSAGLGFEDVKFVYAGLVPVSGIDPQTGAVRRAGHFQIRDHRLDGLPGLISVLGVKYTTARGVAQKVVDLVVTCLGFSAPASRSAQTRLRGGEIDVFSAYLSQEMDRRPCGLGRDLVRMLVHNYGSAYPEVLRYLPDTPQAAGTIDIQERALTRAQVIYAVRHEMALKLSDILFRRLETGVTGHPGTEMIAFCAQQMATLLKWDADRTASEIQEAERYYVHTAANPLLGRTA